LCFALNPILAPAGEAGGKAGKRRRRYFGLAAAAAGLEGLLGEVSGSPRKLMSSMIVVS